MLKKVFIMLVGALMIFNQSNAQVLNSKGEKVIKRIEVCYETEDDVYYTVDFGYDSYLRLKRIEENSENSGRIIFERSGNVIKRTDYKENGTLEDVRYRFELNEKGIIKRKIVDDFDDNGNIFREVCYYGYSAGNNKLSSRYKDIFQVQKNGKETFCYRHIEEFGWKNGDMYASDLQEVYNGDEWISDIRWDKRTYCDNLYVNDTNIDLFEFYLEFNNLFNFECVTEWVNCKSEHLIESYRPRNVNFHYCYDSGNEDCLGNIIKIYVSEYGKEKYVFRIYYL